MVHMFRENSFDQYLRQQQEAANMHELHLEGTGCYVQWQPTMNRAAVPRIIVLGEGDNPEMFELYRYVEPRNGGKRAAMYRRAFYIHVSELIRSK